MEAHPPWMAAPQATTSSGLTPREGSLPKSSRTISPTCSTLKCLRVAMHD